MKFRFSWSFSLKRLKEKLQQGFSEKLQQGFSDTTPKAGSDISQSLLFALQLISIRQIIFIFIGQISTQKYGSGHFDPF